MTNSLELFKTKRNIIRRRGGKISFFHCSTWRAGPRGTIFIIYIISSTLHPLFSGRDNFTLTRDQCDMRCALLYTDIGFSVRMCVSDKNGAKKDSSSLTKLSIHLVTLLE